MERGETLRDIAQRYAVRLDVLYRVNGLKEEDTLRDGDIIRLR